MTNTRVITHEEIKQIIVKNLCLIAPEAEVNALRPHDEIREMLEVDQVDFLNFLNAIAKELGVEVPGPDDGRTNTIEKLSTHLLAHMGP
ncbi:MAG: acyl carrier protein [Anaerolineales bacterium]|nr:acyl carrier protein [Anaerolineales bacterium]